MNLIYVLNIVCIAMNTYFIIFRYKSLHLRTQEDGKSKWFHAMQRERDTERTLKKLAFVPPVYHTKPMFSVVMEVTPFLE